ncbi:hypothetical protein [Qipengyuania oceanensis]|uniref:Uncharacterized protein n=1 Tax=Qipengyuania oceanensis TaxID=1463597 RepID=A0A844YCB0_9SPHN|nr:hypothetical protein [Qipengyuania oceanensis]MXO61617.1 hypothetical protein [Qipengyuania oceanensis]
MNSSVSHEDLQAQIVELLFDAMNQDAGFVGPDQIGQNLNISGDRVTLAASALVRKGYLQARYNTRSGARYQISEQAYLDVEERRAKEMEVVGKSSSDPIQALEEQIAPAAGRMVSFGDNQSDADQAIEIIEEATSALRSSNKIDTELRDETVINLDTWKGMVAKGQRFAVGAFRFLVWDRIKAVIENGIEDIYRVALVTALITLGTLIVALF